MSEELPTYRELIDEVRSGLNQASQSLAKAQAIHTEVITAARALSRELTLHPHENPEVVGCHQVLMEALVNYDGGRES